MEKPQDKSVSYFREGHPVFPEGRVIETKDGVTTEYTLKQWQEQQQSQQQS